MTRKSPSSNGVGQSALRRGSVSNSRVDRRSSGFGPATRSLRTGATVPRKGAGVAGLRGGLGRDRSLPINLNYSRFDGDGFVRAGLGTGANGIYAYYDRQRFRNFGIGGRRFNHYYNDCFAPVFYSGAFFGGLYYPYGHWSAFDFYYYRYPYNYGLVSTFGPRWTVFVDSPPIVETVYVTRPDTTVIVDDSSSTVVYPDVSLRDVDPNFVGPVAPTTTADGGREIEVAPQDKIPVNNEWLATGHQQFSSGEYNEALRSFSYAVLEESFNGFAGLSYGLALFASGDYGGAADSIRRGMSLVPDVVDRPIDIARQYGNEADLASHRQALELYLANNGGDGDAWFLLGYLEYSTGRAGEAAVAFERAVSVNPEDSYSLVLRDASRRITGDTSSNE